MKYSAKSKTTRYLSRAVAGENITRGSVVALDSNNKIVNIKQDESFSTLVNGAVLSGPDSSGGLSQTVSLGNNVYVSSYRENSSGNNSIGATVYRLNSDNTITIISTKENFSNISTNDPNVVVINDETFVLVFGENVFGLNYVVGKWNGTTVSYNSTVNMSSKVSRKRHIPIALTNDRFIIIMGGNDEKCSVMIGTVSGNDVTFTNEVTIHNIDPDNKIDACLFSEDRILVTHGVNGDTSTLYSFFIDVNQDNTLNVGTVYQTSTPSSYITNEVGKLRCVKINSNTFGINYYTNDNISYLTLGHVDNQGAISFSSIQFGNNTSIKNMVFLEPNKFVYGYAMGTSNTTKICVYDDSTQSVTTNQIITNTSHQYIHMYSVAYDPKTNYLHFIGYDNGITTYFGYRGTNIDKWVGIAQYDADINDEVVLASFGSTYNSKTVLNTGATYYATTGGELVDIESSKKIGKAISPYDLVITESI